MTISTVLSSSPVRWPITAVFRAGLAAAIRDHDVLRVKGFADVPGRDRRLVIQAVGAPHRTAFRSALGGRRGPRDAACRHREKGSRPRRHRSRAGRVCRGRLNASARHRARASSPMDRPRSTWRKRRATSSCWRAPTPRSRCSRRRRRGGAADDPDAPTVRLAPVMRLGHNFSVDLYMEVVARARLVIARLLGGSAYWPYGVERLAETCREQRHPARAVAGRRQARPRTGAALDRAAGGVPPALALSGGRRAGQRR